MGGDGTVPAGVGDAASRPTACSRRTSRCTRPRCTARCSSPRPCRPSCAGSSRPARCGRSARVRGVRVEADDILATGESLLVRALPDAAGLTLRAAVTDVATGRSSAEPVAGAATPTRSTPASSHRCRPATTASASTASSGSEDLADPVHSAGVRRRRRRAGRRPGRRLTGDAHDPRPARGDRRLRGADQPAVRLPQRHGRAADLPRGTGRGRPPAARPRGRRGDPRHVRDRVPRAPRARPGRATSPCSPSSATAARNRRPPRSPPSNRPVACRRSCSTTAAGASTGSCAGRSPTRSSAC